MYGACAVNTVGGANFHIFHNFYSNTRDFCVYLIESMIIILES